MGDMNIRSGLVNRNATASGPPGKDDRKQMLEINMNADKTWLWVSKDRAVAQRLNQIKKSKLTST